MIDFDKLQASANSDAEFKLAARFWDSRLEIAIGDETTELLVINGSIVNVGPSGAFGDELRAIRIAAAESDWAELLSVRPGPLHANVELSPFFEFHGSILDRGPYFNAVQRLLHLMREQVSGPSSPARLPRIERDADDAIGRYMYVDVDDTQYRIYYEEAGSGIPMVLMHTAGSDGRQWRHVLENRVFQQDFRMVAFDMPYHGKSLPPVGKEWWTEEYLPTRQWLIDLTIAVADKLEMDRPVFMGCSIGGLVAPAIAFECPDRFRAVIAVNGGLVGEYEPNDNRVRTGPTASPPTFLNSWGHPRIGNEWKGASMAGLMAPSSPEAYRRETAWGYMLGAPGVFRGDSLATAYEFPLTEDQARTIDTSVIGVYFLTGEYDPFALDGGSERLADCIPGSWFTLIKDAGHFAPCDNPAAFHAALEPVLGHIVDAGR